MKKTLLLGLTSFLFIITTQADQPVSYPKKDPLIDLVFPEGWTVQVKANTILATPKDDESFIVSLSPMESTQEEAEEAAQEAKDIIEEDFENVSYEELQKLENDGVAILLLQAKGTDEDGPAIITCSMINQPEAESLLLLQFIASKKGFEKYGAQGLELIQSIKAHGLPPALQTYSYPSKEDPVFALDFPADWKMEADAESAYIVSPDKLVAMNVLLIDQGELPVAVKALKKQTGDKFDSIEWTESKKSTDEELGLSATFHHGAAVSGDTKISVNIAEYVRKDGDKFLVLICQHPLEALEVHADAIEQTIRSIKAK